MEEREIINKIKELKQIKPRSEWVLLTKENLLGNNDINTPAEIGKWVSWQFQKKFSFVLTTAFVAFVVILSQTSVPGDILYSVKRMTEAVELRLAQKDKTQLHLELANRRLDELDKIVKENRVESLAPAIKEFQENIVKAADELEKLNTNSSTQPAVIKEIVKETQKLEKKKEEIKSLGIIVGETEVLESALAKLVENELKDLENRTLTAEQQEILEKAKEAYEAKDYAKALENILLINGVDNK